METSTKNWQMVSEVELVYKTRVKASERLQIKSSKEACNLLQSTWDQGKIEYFEQFKILFLNHSLKVLGLYEMSSGGITGTIVDIRMIFSAALKANATNLMIAHNHPSGNTTPSEADKAITKKIKQAGEILDIKLLDHLIITSESYYSFTDNGAL
ncbi:JAB domain-containing protein [Flavobacterium piscisymbiosum]|uniref:JAB domain-containing protein n=1 Tax=Flavobacterium piscisymbiosum TaxID=2893753 RepID=A0ABS8MDV9_9FLAO|nr:JAB domain-containing protein [Flavobacterium sp. F-30]MCC9063624.1 JAB domain-containing protein [Flavobacterium sp. F-30]